MSNMWCSEWKISRDRLQLRSIKNAAGGERFIECASRRRKYRNVEDIKEAGFGGGAPDMLINERRRGGCRRSSGRRENGGRRRGLRREEEEEEERRSHMETRQRGEPRRRRQSDRSIYQQRPFSLASRGLTLLNGEEEEEEKEE